MTFLRQQYQQNEQTKNANTGAIHQDHSSLFLLNSLCAICFSIFSSFDTTGFCFILSHSQSLFNWNAIRHVWINPYLELKSRIHLLLLTHTDTQTHIHLSQFILLRKQISRNKQLTTFGWRKWNSRKLFYEENEEQAEGKSGYSNRTEQNRAEDALKESFFQTTTPNSAICICDLPNVIKNGWKREKNMHRA